MSKSVLVKPKRKGLKVFNPSTKLHIKESGDEVVMNNYWKRRLKDDEIEVAEIKKKAAKKTSKKIADKKENNQTGDK